MKKTVSLLCEQHIMLLDTTVGTFFGPPVGSTATKYLKRWYEEGTRFFQNSENRSVFSTYILWYFMQLHSYTSSWWEGADHWVTKWTVRHRLYRVLLSNRLVIGYSSEVTSQTQAIRSTAVRIPSGLWLDAVRKYPFRHKLYRVLLSEYRLVIGCNSEVTIHTQAVQSTAVRIPVCDWLQFGSIHSDTSCTEYFCQNTGLWLAAARK